MTTTALHPSTHFPVPAETTAPAPAEHRGVARDGVRLLVARTPDDIRHRTFRDLPDELEPGDLVVVNTSATIAAETDAVSASRGAVVVHVATRLDDGTWVVELRTAPDARRAILDAEPGETVTLDGATLTLVQPYPREHSSPTGVGNRLWRAAVSGDLPATLGRTGRPIAYGYLDRRYPLADYQTVFGIDPGSAEMPSAARPFTADLVTALIAKGVGVSPVTLHTGLSSQEAGEAPQAERYRRPRGHRGGRQRDQGPRGPRRRGRNDRHARARDGRGRRRPGLREQRLDRARHHARRPRPRRRRADHRVARPRGLAPDAGGVGGRTRAHPGGVRRRGRRRVSLARVRGLRAAAAELSRRPVGGAEAER